MIFSIPSHKMSHHARIEELSDSDSDPPEADLDDLQPTDIIRPATQAPPRSAVPPSHTPSDPLLEPQFAPRAPQSTSTLTPAQKRYHCLYPLYFDASRSRAEGRRVGKDIAVPNPLARTIVDACASLSYDVVFEPGKMHPKDWANVGRVRVGGLGRGRNSIAHNKHHLYILVAKYLKEHPTTESSPMSLKIAGVPPPEKPPGKPAVPKGWKINDILPLHSPALSGGGVSDNIIGDMMKGLQGMEGMEGMGGMGAGGGAGGGGGGNNGGGGGGKKKNRKA